MWSILLLGTALASKSCDDYFTRFGKSYNSVEKQHRCDVLMKNRAGYTQKWHGDNKFSDWEKWEFDKLNGIHRTADPSCDVVKNISVNSAPLNFDWRDKNAVSSVKNQGMCGDCWAESAVGSLESAIYLSGGPLLNLSVQELVDCSHNGNDGCYGGLMDNAFQWIKNNGGVCSDRDYPYMGHECKCHNCKKKYTVTKCYDLEPKNEDLMLATLLKSGPLSIAVDADPFRKYSNGILMGSDCTAELNHGVVLVGYGEDNGVKYWTIKNSWGADWGEEGYIRLERGVDACGLSQVVSYPVV